MPKGQKLIDALHDEIRHLKDENEALTNEAEALNEALERAEADLALIHHMVESGEPVPMLTRDGTPVFLVRARHKRTEALH